MTTTVDRWALYTPPNTPSVGVEASDLGWGPGHWPDTFVYQPYGFNGAYTFQKRVVLRSPDGEFWGFTYIANAGSAYPIILDVFND